MNAWLLQSPKVIVREKCLCQVPSLRKGSLTTTVSPDTSLPHDAFNEINMESLIVKLSRKNVAKMIVTFSRIRREQVFLTW